MALYFGEVVSFDGGEYVYLHAEPEVIFLAKIIDPDYVRKLNDLFSVRNGNGSNVACRSLESSVYCFVELSTEKYQGHGAHLAKTEYEFSDVSTPICILDISDKEKLKSEILRDGSPCDGRLKDVVQKLSFV